MAGDPSRGRQFAGPRRRTPRWLDELLHGRADRFEKVALSARVPKIAARWIRFLLLLAGDIERNPGPPKRIPRGPGS